MAGYVRSKLMAWQLIYFMKMAGSLGPLPVAMAQLVKM